jgi:hypothetical protein
LAKSLSDSVFFTAGRFDSCPDQVTRRQEIS